MKFPSTPFRALGNRTQFISGLSGDLMENGIPHFFPGAALARVGQWPERMSSLLAFGAILQYQSSSEAINRPKRALPGSMQWFRLHNLI